MFKKIVLGLVCVAVGGTCLGIDIDLDPRILHRGDANNDGGVNISDASYISNFLFLGGPEPECMNQADVNNDGLVDVSDPAFLANWLFKGGPQPPSPGPYNTECAQDAPINGRDSALPFRCRPNSQDRSNPRCGLDRS